MFTLEELAFYLPDTADNPDRAQLIQDLTFGRIYATIPQDIADASPVARAIALEVAARAYRNAQGYAREQVDDYSYQRPATTQEAGVYLTEGERAELLRLAEVGGRKRVRSVRLRSWSAPWT